MDIPEVAVLAEGHHFRKNCVVAEFESIINRINGWCWVHLPSPTTTTIHRPSPQLVPNHGQPPTGAPPLILRDVGPSRSRSTEENTEGGRSRGRKEGGRQYVTKPGHDESRGPRSSFSVRGYSRVGRTTEQGLLALLQHLFLLSYHYMYVPSYKPKEGHLLGQNICIFFLTLVSHDTTAVKIRKISWTCYLWYKASAADFPKMMALGKHSHFGDVCRLFWHFCINFNSLTLIF